MKKLLLGLIFLSLAIVVPVSAIAGVNISIGFPLPPPIVFEAPPSVIVMPDTSGVYVVPDVEFDLFFWNGWWWRPWEGGWYRSHYYNRGWRYYNNVPSFYYDVDPGWRGYYRDRNWYGHPWDYQMIPQPRLQRNWKSWDSNRYWERQGTWGVRGYQSRPPQQRQEIRMQRQQQYQQRPEVQQHQQQRQRGVQPTQRGGTVTPQGSATGRSERQQVQPTQRGGTVTPQGGATGRSGRQQVQPTQKGGTVTPQGSPTGRSGRQEVQPTQKGGTVTPQGGPTGRSERQQVQPTQKGGTVTPQGSPTGRSGGQQVQPTQKSGSTRPQGGPTGRGERKRDQPADNTSGPESAPASRSR